MPYSISYSVPLLFETLKLVYFEFYSNDTTDTDEPYNIVCNESKSNLVLQNFFEIK